MQISIKFQIISFFCCHLKPIIGIELHGLRLWRKKKKQSERENFAFAYDERLSALWFHFKISTVIHWSISTNHMTTDKRLLDETTQNKNTADKEKNPTAATIEWNFFYIFNGFSWLVTEKDCVYWVHIKAEKMKKYKKVLLLLSILNGQSMNSMDIHFQVIGTKKKSVQSPDHVV